MSAPDLGGLLLLCLAEGETIELEGLGRFCPDATGDFHFTGREHPQVFIAYVQEDTLVADRLFDALAGGGFQPWMDRRKLLPGQNWPRAIEAAIESSDMFIGCFSSRSVMKRGGFQAEIRYALDCARRIPLDEIFLVPVRLDDCRVPARIQREWQYVDLFPDWDRGVQRLLRTLRRRR